LTISRHGKTIVFAKRTGGFDRSASGHLTSLLC
jgi:hypothetical protein